MAGFSEGISRFNQALDMQPDFQRALLRSQGIDPLNAEKMVQPLLARQQAENNQMQVNEILQRSGGNPSKVEIMQMFALNPEYAKMVLELNARPAASSTLGKALEDVRAGIIPEEYQDAIIKKATTIAPVYDPVTKQLIYAGGEGFNAPTINSGGVVIPSEYANNPAAAQVFIETNAKLAAERGGEVSKKETGASNMLDLIDEARTLLPLATSGKLETMAKEAAQAVGYSTDASQADAQLKVIGANLTSNIPRMEGPQSDKDTQMYREAASDVANTLLPAGDRMAALKILEKIQKKYAGKGFVTAEPITSKYQEGQTATGANGQKLVFTNGKWRAQ
jgi:hypothetical protein